MTEQKFDSKFHKMYVGGEGEVIETPLHTTTSMEIQPRTLEDILEEYRRYVNDPKAELPEIVLTELRKLGKI